MVSWWGVGFACSEVGGILGGTLQPRGVRCSMWRRARGPPCGFQRSGSLRAFTRGGAWELGVNVTFASALFNAQKELRRAKLGSYFSLKFVIPYVLPLIKLRSKPVRVVGLIS